jgi:shikimate kinase
LEADVVDELTQQGAGVLSTGGGVVLRESNRVNLRSRTRVVYLNSTPDELFRRLKHDKSRPLLQVADPLGRLRDLHTQRDPLYRETAHFNIDSGGPSVSSLVHMIASQLDAVAVAGRWRGMVDGTADLSTNPVHMQGFGK